MHRLALLTLLALLLSGCGEGGPTDAEKAEASASADAERFAEAAAENAEEAAAAEEAEAERVRAAKTRRFQACTKGTKPLMSALQQINSRLSIGMNFDEYGDRVGDAQVGYDQVFAGPDLERTCLLKVGVPLEGALNKYIEVFNIWNDCVQDYYCDFNEGETNDKAQKRWGKATTMVAAAEKGLSGLKP
ncbi:hypothetical protein [Nocardioides sp.]|uniref:hypothetical protein n=1 Tax=Nocardioides sp. TaxID=35761 RepID=UPI00286CB786|nr:hypothetical protein [Nocardioides sp.]